MFLYLLHQFGFIYRSLRIGALVDVTRNAFQSALADRKQSPEQLADQTMAFLEPSVRVYFGDRVTS